MTKEPDVDKLRIIPIKDGHFRWALFSDDPEWLPFTDRGTGIVMRFPSKKAAGEWRDHQKRRLKVVQDRQCGDCRVCCSALTIVALDKPWGEPCKHLVQTGCGIYEQRPSECSEYLCGWRRGMGDEEHRPDLIGVLLTAHDNKPEVAALLECPVSFIAHEARPAAFAEKPAHEFLERVAGRLLVLGFHGPRREKCRLMGPADMMHTAFAWCEANGFAGDPTGILVGAGSVLLRGAVKTASSLLRPVKP